MISHSGLNFFFALGYFSDNWETICCVSAHEIYHCRLQEGKIVSAGTIIFFLVRTRLTQITLDCFPFLCVTPYLLAYPGWWTHNILLELQVWKPGHDWSVSPRLLYCCPVCLCYRHHSYQHSHNLLSQGGKETMWEDDQGNIRVDFI